MKIAAYCAQSWRLSTWRVTGVWPITSPPVTAETLDLTRITAPVVYIRLHGFPGQPYLYGDPGLMTALTAEQVKAWDFTGSLVFLDGCYGIGFAGAFLTAGAVAVAGADRVTWGRKWRLGPAQIVGQGWLKALSRGETAGDALETALKEVKSRDARGWTIQGDQGAKFHERLA